MPFSEKQFNLVDEPWIPIVGRGLASLREVFKESSFRSLGGNATQKISMMKLLLAIAQAACMLKDAEHWRAMGAGGVAAAANDYLEKKKDCFWLYGPNPFLQLPVSASAERQPIGAVNPSIATGNTTVLTQLQSERPWADAEKAQAILFLTGFALGGKKTDNRIVFSPNYGAKCNDRGKPSTLSVVHPIVRE